MQEPDHDDPLAFPKGCANALAIMGAIYLVYVGIVTAIDAITEGFIGERHDTGSER